MVLKPVSEHKTHLFTHSPNRKKPTFDNFLCKHENNGSCNSLDRVGIFGSYSTRRWQATSRYCASSSKVVFIYHFCNL